MAEKSAGTNAKVKEVEEPKVAPEQKEVKAQKVAPEPKKDEAYYAFADFEIEKLGIKVKAGEQFTPPQGWERNKHQEEFLLGSKQKNSGGSSVGVCFSYLGEVVNPGEKNIELRERRVHNAVLPLEVR